MLFSMHPTRVDFGADGLPFQLGASRCSFTEASVASWSERAPRGANGRAAPRLPLEPRGSILANRSCLVSTFVLFLPRQENETAAPAQGAAVARASSFRPRTVLHQSVTQLEPHAPRDPNSNRCLSCGSGRKLACIRMSQNTFTSP